jgi:hypothetical protein
VVMAATTMMGMTFEPAGFGGGGWGARAAASSVRKRSFSS